MGVDITTLSVNLQKVKAGLIKRANGRVDPEANIPAKLHQAWRLTVWWLLVLAHGMESAAEKVSAK